MKKAAALILLIIYAITSSGATIELHYCMDKLTGWNFEQTSKTGCSNSCSAVMKEKKGCCSDKLIQVKIDKDQQVAYNNVAFAQNSIAIVPECTNIINVLPVSVAFVYTSIHAPPLISSHPAYLLNCNFRI